MTKENSETFLRILGLKGTKEILEYLYENERAQYKMLSEFLNTHTLNIRLSELLGFKLIKHHFRRLDKKEEWYTITEKGRKTLMHLRDLVEILDS